MKKLISTILCLFVCLATFAQSAEPSHLTFKGIPIDGTPTTFGNKLKAAGFTFDYEYDNIHWYKGEFAGYKNCDIGVKHSKNIVYEVVVLFPERYSWAMLINDYTSLKNMLIKKYGEPCVCEEIFKNTPSYRNIEDNNDKFEEVKDNHCCYYAAFIETTTLGGICIEIKGDIPRVGIHYIDYINNSAIESAALNDL